MSDLATAADHMLVGRVVGVDMIDAKGRQLRGDSNHTGPGLDNTIRLRIKVDKVLVTNAPSVPSELLVPLDPFMHYSLGQIREAHAEPSEPALFLLKGKGFSPIVDGAFSWSIEQTDEALRIHAKSHP